MASGKPATAVIIGVVVGAAVLLLVIGSLAFVSVRRRALVAHRAVTLVAHRRDVAAATSSARRPRFR